MPDAPLFDFPDEPLADAAKTSPIDLEKFQRVIAQGHAATLQNNALSEQYWEARENLGKLQAELEHHNTWSDHRRFPPRAGLVEDIAAAEARLKFIAGEQARERDLLTSRIATARLVEDFAARRGIDVDLRRRGRGRRYPDAPPPADTSATEAPAPEPVPSAQPAQPSARNENRARATARGYRR